MSVDYDLTPWQNPNTGHWFRIREKKDKFPGGRLEIIHISEEEALALLNKKPAPVSGLIVGATKYEWFHDEFTDTYTCQKGVWTGEHWIWSKYLGKEKPAPGTSEDGQECNEFGVVSP